MKRISFSLTVIVCLSGAGIRMADAQTPVALTSGKEARRIPVAASPLITDPKLADYSTDLRPLLEKKSLKNGETFLSRTPEGLRVFAISDKGELSGLVVRDAYGDTLDQLEVWGRDRDRRPEEKATTSRKNEDEIHCWRCFSYRGETHCFEILCPLPQIEE